MFAIRQFGVLGVGGPRLRSETDVLPVTESYGLGVLVWSPLSSGWLSGAIRAGQEITTNRSNLMPQRFDLDVPANRVTRPAITDATPRRR